MREITYWLETQDIRMMCLRTDYAGRLDIYDADENYINGIEYKKLPEFITSLRWLADELEKDFPV